MSDLSQWFSADLLRPLGLTLLHFLWQGVAVAALASVALALSRRGAVRYVVALVALAAMVAAPVITFAVLQSSGSPDESMMVIANPSSPAELHVAQPESHARAEVAEKDAGMGLSATSLVWLVQGWFAGVLLFSVRTAGGLLVIARLRRREAAPVSEKLLALCLRLQERLGLARVVRYCESVQLDAPAVAGWFRPVVFLPATALTGLSEAQLETVIAHELAHVQRLDGLVNLFQIAAETLLFYHPGVWWLSRRVREEREHCCDDAAISVCGNAVEYARALTMMEEWRSAPALAMAVNRSPLAARISRLLGIGTSGSAVRSPGLAAGILCLTAALVAGNALFGVAHSAAAAASQSPTKEQTATTQDERDATFVITAPRPKTQVKAAPKAEPALAPTPALPANPTPTAIPTPVPTPTPQANATPTPAPAARANPAAAGSYIDAMKAAGLDNLSVDDLVGLKIQGVTPEYVRSMKELGLRVDADELIGMKVQGITPEYVREMRAASGQPALTGDELIGLKVQGVTPEYIKQMHELGVKTDADDIIGMKVQGVTPAYIRELRGMGLKVDADEIIGMKVQGITPEYAKSFQELGLHPNADDLIGMKVQGITAAYLKEMQAAGFKLDVDDAIGAKVQGVTPEFIAKARSYGFKNLTMDQIIQLKHTGVLEKQPEKK
jgi:beta-lactamase regulating signal transducer with metallopeptidase domain